MLLLIMIVEVMVIFALGFHLTVWAQGNSRMRDWSPTSLYPRRGSPRTETPDTVNRC
jgi:hypothetical protein